MLFDNKEILEKKKPHPWRQFGVSNGTVFRNNHCVLNSEDGLILVARIKTPTSECKWFNLIWEYLITSNGAIGAIKTGWRDHVNEYKAYCFEEGLILVMRVGSQLVLYHNMLLDSEEGCTCSRMLGFRVMLLFNWVSVYPQLLQAACNFCANLPFCRNSWFKSWSIAIFEQKNLDILAHIRPQ